MVRGNTFAIAEISYVADTESYNYKAHIYKFINSKWIKIKEIEKTKESLTFMMQAFGLSRNVRLNNDGNILCVSGISDEGTTIYQYVDTELNLNVFTSTTNNTLNDIEDNVTANTLAIRDLQKQIQQLLE